MAARNRTSLFINRSNYTTPLTAAEGKDPSSELKKAGSLLQRQLTIPGLFEKLQKSKSVDKS